MISAYFIHLGIMFGMYALLTLSLNLTVGYTGLLNLGHIAFFGIGAYVTAILSPHMPLAISIPLAVILAAAAGTLLALPCGKLRGDYLALATLGFTFICGSIARNWISLTRGALGIAGIQRMGSNTMIVVSLLALVLVVYLILRWFVSTPTGRVLQAVRDDEVAAATLGKDVFKHKILCLAISAGIAGLAGAFYAHYITFIDPSVFSINELILLLSMLIVGGLASLEGSILGALILVLLPEPLRFIGFPSSLVGPMRAMIFALLLLLIVLYKPRGLLGKVDLE